MRTTLLALGAALLFACDREPEPAGASPSPSPAAVAARPPPEIVKAEPALADGRAWVRSELARAEADGRKLVIYVGATWCEPCVRFHDAVLAGRLDAELAGVRFLELDADAHERVRGDADLGCTSRMIPLFARPTPEGRCGEARVEGAIKGDGAVDFLMPKLARLLEG